MSRMGSVLQGISCDKEDIPTHPDVSSHDDQREHSEHYDGGLYVTSYTVSLLP